MQFVRARDGEKFNQRPKIFGARHVMNAKGSLVLSGPTAMRASVGERRFNATGCNFKWD